MFMGRTVARICLPTAAALALAGAAGPANAQTPSAPQERVKAGNCAAQALIDHVDRTDKMYGSGGIDCKNASAGLVVTVYLIGGGNTLAKAGKSCPSINTTCFTNTKAVHDKWSGKQEWCAHTVASVSSAHMGEWDCTRH